MTCCNFFNCLKVVNFVMVNQGKQGKWVCLVLANKDKDY